MRRVLRYVGLVRIYDSFEMLFLWFKTIWKFRGYDFYYIYSVLYKAIELNERSFKQAPVSNDNELETLAKAKVLLKRLMDDNYAEICGYEYDFEIDFEPIDENKTKFVIKDNSTDEQKANNERALKDAVELQQKEKAELFNLMKNNIETWWW